MPGETSYLGQTDHQVQVAPGEGQACHERAVRFDLRCEAGRREQGDVSRGWGRRDLPTGIGVSAVSARTTPSPPDPLPCCWSSPEACLWATTAYRGMSPGASSRARGDRYLSSPASTISFEARARGAATQTRPYHCLAQKTRGGEPRGMRHYYYYYGRHSFKKSGSRCNNHCICHFLRLCLPRVVHASLRCGIRVSRQIGATMPIG